MGIFLVVVGHVLRGLVKASIIPGSGFEDLVDAWIYSFHMPLFFFISGIFAGTSVRKPLGAYFLEKLKGIVYPYMVWCLIQGLIQISVSNYTNSPMTLADLSSALYRPPAQFWFLYVLFMIMIIFGVMKKLRIGGLGFFLFSVGSYFSIVFFYLGPWGVIYMVRENIIYFAIGVFLNSWVLTVRENSSNRNFLLLSFALLLALTICVWYRLEQFLLLRPLLAALGIFSTVFLSKLLSSKNWCKTVRKWGVVSLQIYVAHSIASAGFRVFLQKLFGYEGAWVHLCGGICAGMYFPVFLDWVCRKIRFKYLFTLR